MNDWNRPIAPGSQEPLHISTCINCSRPIRLLLSGGLTPVWLHDPLFEGGSGAIDCNGHGGGGSATPHGVVAGEVVSDEAPCEHVWMATGRPFPDRLRLAAPPGSTYLCGRCGGWVSIAETAALAVNVSDMARPFER